jgi:hypothetical protein
MQLPASERRRRQGNILPAKHKLLIVLGFYSPNGRRSNRLVLMGPLPIFRLDFKHDKIGYPGATEHNAKLGIMFR